MEYTSSYTGEQIDYSVKLANGHKYVDLGLPSGTLWATYDLSPATGCGSMTPNRPSSVTYSANTNSFNSFLWGSLSSCVGMGYSTAPYVDTKAAAAGTNTQTYTKYSTASTLTTLEACDDAARVIWGFPWRIPTQSDFQELIDNCTISRESSGFHFTGPNGNSIYFSYVGRMNSTGSVTSSGSSAFYWTSSLSSDDDKSAYQFLCSSNTVKSNLKGLRSLGTKIRPVMDKVRID